MLKLIDGFVSYCLKYPDMRIESVFNRYMQLLTKGEIEKVQPCFELMIKAGECARDSIPEVQELIIQEMKKGGNYV